MTHVEARSKKRGRKEQWKVTSGSDFGFFHRIGHDVVQRLTKSGYAVVATARNPVTIDDVQVTLKLPLSVTQQDSTTKAVESTIQRFGRIDVLVNNAGYAVRGAVEEISDEQVQKMFDVTVFGVMRMIRTVAPYMRQQRAGRIISIGSIGGKLASPVNGTYSATKFALEALSMPCDWSWQVLTFRLCS